MLMQSDQAHSAARRTFRPHEIFQRAFYPLTLPLTVGPGSISVADPAKREREPSARR